jgi:hypothetical protein
VHEANSLPLPSAVSACILLLLLLFPAVGFAAGGSSPALVQIKTIKQHCTLVQHNTIKRKQNNTYIIQ